MSRAGVGLVSAASGAVVLGLLVAPSGGAAEQDLMKEPLALMAQAQQAYAKVQDYTCTLSKRETVHGELSTLNVMALDVRTSPFSVFMQWKAPASLKGQKVCYNAAESKTEMRVRPTGWLGYVSGFVSIGVNSPRARENSIHPITQIGIGGIIDTFSVGWKLEQKLGKTQVKIRPVRFAGRLCTRVTLTHPTSAGGQLHNYCNVVYFDQKTHLPIGVQNYDWPSENGGEAPLLEEFRYSNVQLNVGLTASTFEH